MRTVNRIELFAKPEVKSVLEGLKTAARRALPNGDFAECEAVMLTIFDEAGRGLLEEELQTMADGFDDRVAVNGIEHKRHEPGTVSYSGVLRVRRHTYRRADIRNGPTVVPLELVAGLAEGATPALAYNVVHGYAQHDMRLHGESLEAAQRTPPPRATLERMAQRLAATANLDATRVEAVVRKAELETIFQKRGLCRALHKAALFRDRLHYDSLLDRSRPQKVADYELRVAAPEDVLLMKLLAARPLDLADAAALVRTHGKEMDTAYLERWARELDVEQEVARALAAGE